MYCKQFTYFITKGFDEKIEVYHFDQFNNEVDHVKTLIGHQSIVSAICLFEERKQILSVDDKNIMRLWDIAGLKCIQIIKIQLKEEVIDLISFNSQVCIISTRVMIINYNELEEQILKSVHCWTCGNFDELSLQLLMSDG